VGGVGPGLGLGCGAGVGPLSQTQYCGKQYGGFKLQFFFFRVDISIVKACIYYVLNKTWNIDNS